MKPKWATKKRVYTSTIIVQWMCRLRNECSFRLLLQTKLKLVFGVYLEFKVLWNSIILSWKCMVFFFSPSLVLFVNESVHSCILYNQLCRSVNAKDGLLHRWASTRRRIIAISQTKILAPYSIFTLSFVNFHPKIRVLQKCYYFNSIIYISTHQIWLCIGEVWHSTRRIHFSKI